MGDSTIFNFCSIKFRKSQWFLEVTFKGLFGYDFVRCDFVQCRTTRAVFHKDKKKSFAKRFVKWATPIIRRCNNYFQSC